jgi:hypothetical protein
MKIHQNKEIEELRIRSIWSGKQRMLIKMIENIDEADFYRLAAFQAGYEAGRTYRERIRPEEEA